MIGDSISPITLHHPNLMLIFYEDLRRKVTPWGRISIYHARFTRPSLMMWSLRSDPPTPIHSNNVCFFRECLPQDTITIATRHIITSSHFSRLYILSSPNSLDVCANFSIVYDVFYYHCVRFLRSHDVNRSISEGSSVWENKPRGNKSAKRFYVTHSSGHHLFFALSDFSLSAISLSPYSSSQSSAYPYSLIKSFFF